MPILDNPRVLVVDDERHMRNMLELGLGQHGFDVVCAADGAEALERVRERSFDAIVLDVMMPRIDGTSLVPMLRRLTEAPIIMLSARKESPDQIAALTAGADDYVGKPFDLGELAARLHSRLRRPRLAKRDTLVYAGIALDTAGRKAEFRSAELDLTAREFDLLATFVREPGRVFTREQLIDSVWGTEVAVEPNVVETYVSYLRAKLEPIGGRGLIRTIRRVGYTLREDLL
ncbi:MAG TPA: response regulator transcription factor [Candidatus Acidoferrales bacterium]|nr:response regulator transcription factor [Candidatus Acidoferrales bacterium]